MSYTVAASFDKFRQNIEISSDHRETATKRRDRIVSLLGKNFTMLDAFTTGSLPRFTAITGYGDLDVMVVLHYSKHVKGKKPSELLQDVRDALGEYRTNVRKNGQAVTLYYKSWPNVDIVPVSRTVNSDDTVNHYNVPNMNNETWIRSRPVLHSTNMSDRNKVCGDTFKRIVKMIKWWNRKHGNFLQSFHIEVMALKIFNGSLNDYPWDVYYYFRQASEMLKHPLWHDGDYVDKYLSDTARAEALQRLETAREKALSAWYLTYDYRNEHEEAIKLWRQIFGDKFPPYGA